MAQITFTVTISEIDNLLFQGEAFSVTLPGASGELTLLPKHEPLISLLTSGTITVRTSEGEKQFPVTKGVLETSNNQLTVLI